MSAGVITLLRHGEYRTMPWKNGGGETAEIAVFPPSAGMDTFGWRISMATVSADGPFSLFTGIDRTLTVVDGAGLVLDMDSRSIVLTKATPPVFFTGDRPVFGRLSGGPIRDLNVMTRRGLFHHRVDRAGAGRLDVPDGSLHLVLFAVDPCTVRIDDAVFRLERFDMLCCPEPSRRKTEISDMSGQHGVLAVVLHAASSPAGAR